MKTYKCDFCFTERDETYQYLIKKDDKVFCDHYCEEAFEVLEEE